MAELFHRNGIAVMTTDIKHDTRTMHVNRACVCGKFVQRSTLERVTHFNDSFSQVWREASPLSDADSPSTFVLSLANYVCKLVHFFTIG